MPPYTGKRDFADMIKDPQRRDILLDYLGGPMSVLLRGRQEGQRERDLEKLRAGFGEEEEATSHGIRWLLEAGKGERTASPQGFQKHAGLSRTLMRPRKTRLGLVSSALHHSNFSKPLSVR